MDRERICWFEGCFSSVRLCFWRCLFRTWRQFDLMIRRRGRTPGANCFWRGFLQSGSIIFSHHPVPWTPKGENISEESGAGVMLFCRSSWKFKDMNITGTLRSTQVNTVNDKYLKKWPYLDVGGAAWDHKNPAPASPAFLTGLSRLN